MPLTGTLRDLSLSNLIQVQCGEQARAQMTLTRPCRKGTLVFANGELIFAATDNKTGQDAVYELLTWEDGDFIIDNEIVIAERNVDIPWSALLLEGLRLADEARAERDAILESNLRAIAGKQGLRAALATNSDGLVKADAKGMATAEDAAWIAFIATRMEKVGTALNLGGFTELVAVNPREKVMIAKSDSNYIAGWLDGRTTSDQIAALQQQINRTK